MNTDESLKVRVTQRGDKYIWELHREGIVLPVRYSAPVFMSQEAAVTSGNEARTAHLARLAAKWPKKRRI